jgi:hypothetical protein
MADWMALAKDACLAVCLASGMEPMKAECSGEMKSPWTVLQTTVTWENLTAIVKDLLREWTRERQTGALSAPEALRGLLSVLWVFEFDL